MKKIINYLKQNIKFTTSSFGGWGELEYTLLAIVFLFYILLVISINFYWIILPIIQFVYLFLDLKNSNKKFIKYYSIISNTLLILYISYIIFI